MASCVHPLGINPTASRVEDIHLEISDRFRQPRVVGGRGCVCHLARRPDRFTRGRLRRARPTRRGSLTDSPDVARPPANRDH